MFIHIVANKLIHSKQDDKYFLVLIKRRIKDVIDK